VEHTASSRPTPEIVGRGPDSPGAIGSAAEARKNLFRKPGKV